MGQSSPIFPFQLTNLQNAFDAVCDELEVQDRERLAQIICSLSANGVSDVQELKQRAILAMVGDG